MHNVSMIRLKRHSDQYGSLIPVEAQTDAPFSIRRVYYIFDVPEGVRRGFHSHIALQQVLICVSGSVKILVRTPKEEQIIELNDPAQGLYIGPMIWREMYDFSKGAVLLVLASEHYDERDYIRDYHAYLKKAQDYFGA